MFSRLLRPSPPQVAAGRRAYSVFSKPGGGRYFNSAKPPKVTTSVTQKPSSANPNSTGKMDNGATASTTDSTEDVNAGSSSQGVEGQQTACKTFSSLSFPMLNTTPLSHPPVNPQDLRLHQFFSQHRPLLTLSQPTTSIFESPSFPLSNFPPQPPKSEPSEKSSSSAGMMGTIDNPPEASAESDADAARQLARALVVNKVGADLAWEETLMRLGLDIGEGRLEEVKLAEQEYQVYLDSTKRKRRKKMKTHK